MRDVSGLVFAPARRVVSSGAPTVSQRTSARVVVACRRRIMTSEKIGKERFFKPFGTSLVCARQHPLHGGIAQIAKARMGSNFHDDMIKELDLQRLPRFEQVSCHATVSLRRVNSLSAVTQTDPPAVELNGFKMTHPERGVRGLPTERGTVRLGGRYGQPTHGANTRGNPNADEASSHCPTKDLSRSCVR